MVKISFKFYENTKKNVLNFNKSELNLANMVRVITQETYDEVVQENITEFDMSPEEAMQEAIAQFEAQGVDLSNVIKDLALTPGEGHLVSTTINKLKDLCSEEQPSYEEVLKELQVLKTECSKDIARRVRAGKEGAYKILLNLLYTKCSVLQQELRERDKKIIESVLYALTALMDMQPDLLETKGIEMIKTILDNVEDDDIILATLKWTSNCCLKHEMNRQRLFAKNVPENLKLLLNVTGNEKLLIETLTLIRRFTYDDDIRHEFGKAHEHARELAAMMLESIKNLLKDNLDPPLVSELLVTLSSLLVRNELCAAAGDCALLAALARNYDRAAVVPQAAKLATALAGNDDVKRDLVKKGIAPIIVSVLNRHASNAQTAALLLKSIAALTLREPAHSTAFFDNGAPEAIVNCMNVHPDNAMVQKNACWAVRNMVARNREQNSKYLELGIEPLLNSAYEKFSEEFGFDIKSALRDLECDVKLDEQWTGRGGEIEQ